MKTINLAAMVLTPLATIALAGEPNVVERRLPDGLTELRMVSDAGKTIETYRVDLKTHHEPAMNDSGMIRRPH